MAPTKFGLFKARSREHGDQPSTENLLQDTAADKADRPPSPIPSTSRGYTESPPDFSMLALFDSEDEEYVPDKFVAERRSSTVSGDSQQAADYQRLQNESSLVNSSSTLQEDLEQIQEYEQITPEYVQQFQEYENCLVDFDDDSTSYDVNSLQNDDTSIAASEDWSVHCGTLKRPKKVKSKEQELSDMAMWQASNLEVMKNLLNKSGTLDQKIKWEAIATARGLCTLTDSCTCTDCHAARHGAAGVADGDGGLGAAPLLSVVNVGCQIQ